MAQLMETYAVALNAADNAIKLLRSLGFAEQSREVKDRAGLSRVSDQMAC